ncbi:MAG: [FeFe] hydrogenase H-cluster maturation GTPase HydF, partial [Candidatus Adiutrix sp.]
MQTTPRSNRLAIVFFGRRNVGKSALVNALTGQEVSLVSSTPGATADPVSKSMELWPIGPITVIDTAGLDDEGDLGVEKIRRSKEVLSRSDLAVLVYEANQKDKTLEINWLKTMHDEGGRILVVENKIDLSDPSAFASSLANSFDWLPFDLPTVKVSAQSGEGLNLFKDALVALAAQSPAEPSLIASLFPKHALFMLVAPQDIQAPKGRLILPQVQVMRDILDHEGLVSLATFESLPAQIKALSRPPDLVIVDAQIFAKVAQVIPPNWPVTAFSIIMARAKGDLALLLEGARHIDQLTNTSKVLIAEVCTHHALKNDIAREQLPKKLREKAGAS